MKTKLLSIVILICANFALSSISAQSDCDITCPDEDVIVSYSSANGYVVPDFFTMDIIAVSDSCTGGTFSQTPAEGTLLFEGEYEVNLQIASENGDVSCTYNLVVQEGGQGGGKCVIVCPDTLFVEADSNGSFMIADYFADDQLFFGNCEFTDTSQVPNAGSIMVGDTINIFLTYTIEGVTDECSFIIIANSIMGVADEKQILLRMYPNPANSMVYIETEQAVQQIIVYDITGKVALETTKSRFDISLLEKGLYVVQVKTTAGMASKRLVVK